ncbi:hypothetical protein HF638_03875 [Paenibacillus sp. SZ31]|uniref:Uncharacterized protein n=1 Tax=Paenibacillus amylolyticus TaxID=1451 RepID=A0A1R1C3N2_PAEAM|nr:MULTISPECIES: hypothetical protein [Paenibacillus]NMI03097.1 hypothetical protein [Paenibacillus sp. SZ31]OMF16649.1 hypothetical protein BK131_01230 [Paenibacillus amylolyticus]
MAFFEVALIVVTALLLVFGAKTKRKPLLKWGIASLILLLVLIIPSFIMGFMDGLSEGWSAR